jgi:two-component system, OmpR family, phosphate regulon sensor histidine kinase PhoR
MSVASLRRIGGLIREQRDLLVSRWRRQVRTLPSAKGMDTPSLNDHMPFLLDELANALESQPDDSAEEALLQGSPPVHGRQRFQDGFNIVEVVAEYNVLRGCIHDLAEEHGLAIQGNDLRVVNRVVDEAIALAVQTYATQLGLEVKKHRDEHIAFVAHDLRTPLQAIALTVSMIEQLLGQSSANDKAEKLLKVLRRNIQQLEKSVLEVIKTNSDSPATEKLERRNIDLWPLVESVVAGLAPVAAASAVELSNDVPADVLAFADAGLLARVIESLLSYAVNSAPRGAVAVEADELVGGGIECRIKHNGPALSADELGTLFDNHGSITGPQAVGLGLEIVKQSVEAHGGEVSAESSEGQGVIICFRLPPREK